MIVTLQFDPVRDREQVWALVESLYGKSQKEVVPSVTAQKKHTFGLFGMYLLPGEPNSHEYISLYSVASKNLFQKANYRANRAWSGSIPTSTVKKSPLPSAVYVDVRGQKLYSYVKKEHVAFWK